MAKVERTDIAQADLDEIVHYIAVDQERPEIAEQIVLDIAEKCEKYAMDPQIGQAMDHWVEGCRAFRHKRWVILYDEIDDGIEVLRIVDGARDLDELFGR